jgi:LytR cell envelope-related transcriptional attenuator
VTFAFTVHTFVDKIGAYAGFAAAVGLALLALLIFAQARELRRLREWGSNAHDRLADLERRLAAAMELARRAGSAAQRTSVPAATRGPRPAGPTAPAARPAARPVVTASTSSPIRLPLLPAAPAGVGAPALASATVVVPLPATPPGTEAPAAVPSPVRAPASPSGAPTPATPAAPPSPAAAPAIAAAAASAEAPAGPPTEDTPAPAPATAAAQAPVSTPPPTVVEPPAGGNGRHEDSFVEPPRRTPPPPARPGAPARRAPARPSSSRPPARAGAARPAPAAALRARTPTATPRGTSTPPPEHGRRRVLALLAILAGLVVAVVIVVALMSGGGGSGTKPAGSGSATTPVQTTASKPKRKQGAATLAHDKITVAVLNGTATPGLANTVANSLAGDGFQRGVITNASDQQRSVTVVEYTGGHEPEALEVAKALGVPSDGVQPIDPDTQRIACQGAAACAAAVVVTVGADRQQ